MTELTWDRSIAPEYENGVSRGVFYPVGENEGVAWNGLTSVLETFVGAEVSSKYIEGVKYLSPVGGRNFQATVTAFSAPEEFGPFMGDKQFVSGVILTKQPKPRFNFTYQTRVGEDGYKIHLVYNVLATLTLRGHSSTNKSATPSMFSWLFDSVPVTWPGFRPTSSFVIDSTKVAQPVLAELEDTLYGTNGTEPKFPDMTELMSLFGV